MKSQGNRVYGVRGTGSARAGLGSASSDFEDHIDRLLASFPSDSPGSGVLLTDLLASSARGTASGPAPATAFEQSTTALGSRLVSIVESLDRALTSPIAVGSWSVDYLFEQPLPETVPPEWIREISSARIKEDPEFVLPWNDPPLPE
jgi:hypothetical protein